MEIDDVIHDMGGMFSGNIKRKITFNTLTHDRTEIRKMFEERIDISKLIRLDSEFLSISISTAACYLSIHIECDVVSTVLEFPNRFSKEMNFQEFEENYSKCYYNDNVMDFDNFYYFDEAIKFLMPLIMEQLPKLNLKMFHILYDDEDYCETSYLIPYLKNFKPESIKCIALMTRGYALRLKYECLNSLTPEFCNILYLNCPECDTYFKCNEVVINDHEH